MTRQIENREIDMAEIPGTSLKVSRVAIGTWAIGGWMWGGTDEAQSVSTIRAALEHGINLAGSKTKRNTDTFIAEVLQCPRVTSIYVEMNGRP
jgi:hypothetical protein